MADGAQDGGQDQGQDQAAGEVPAVTVHAQAATASGSVTGQEEKRAES